MSNFPSIRPLAAALIHAAKARQTDRQTDRERDGQKDMARVTGTLRKYAQTNSY